MNAIEISHLRKSFREVHAVKDVSFSVERGEIFGLLGPNGAGKTTTIRVLLDLYKADAGEVSILGGVMTQDTKALIGYLPEERGLYQDIPLDRCLIYLGTLKGLPSNIARERLIYWLERFDLLEHQHKKVIELSKGMQQKAQVILTLLHQPELVIIDEPFAALDPLNTQLVKEIMRELRQAGTTILMSTHQMHQVEALCDRIVLIDDGRDVLYGDLRAIRRQFSGNAVLVKTGDPLPVLEGVLGSKRLNHETRLQLAADVTPHAILQQLVHNDINLESFEIATPSLDEIFIKVIQDGDV